MNKKQLDILGLTQVYDLIEAPGSYFAGVKRSRIMYALCNANEVRSAYSRRAAFIECLSRNPHHHWQDIFSHLAPLNLPPKDSLLTLPDLFELKSFCYHYQRLRLYAEKHELKHPELPDMQKLFELLDPEQSGLPAFRLSPLFSSKLADLDKTRQQLNHQLKKERHAYLSEAKTALDMANLKQSFCLSRAEDELICKLERSHYYVLTAESVANLSFSLADSAASNSIKADIAKLNQSIEKEEEKILARLSRKIHAFSILYDWAVSSCGNIGWDYMLAEFALKYSCCIPYIQSRSNPELTLKGLRNLPLELSLQQHKRPYQSLDLGFSLSANLITGPNMGGKSSLLKSLAQCAELCRRAIPIPATEAKLLYYDFVYYNHEQETDSLSSFGAEVVAFNKALNKDGHGLFLLDEFARGTNPKEGEALATAVIGFLASTEHTTIAATHYTKPARIKGIRHFQVKGINRFFMNTLKGDRSLDARLGALAKAMDYSLVEVGDTNDPPLDAMRVAEILGLPEAILKLAGEQIDD